MLEAPLCGIITPLVTPLVRGAIDLDGLERLIDYVIAGGVNGIFVLGTTGEGPSLSYSLREEMIRQTCRLVKGRVSVLVSVSDVVAACTMPAPDPPKMAAIAYDSFGLKFMLPSPFFKT